MSVICQLLHSLAVGGGEVLATRIARRLSGRYRFVFICLDELGTLGGQLRAEGHNVHVLARRSGIDWRCTIQLAQVLRDEGATLIHAHQYAPFFYAATARFLCPAIPIAFTEHGRLYPDYRRPKRVLANRVLLRRCDRVVGVGQAVRRALIANEGLPERRVEVIYNGINLDPYSNRAARMRDRVRRDWGCGPDDFVVIQVARLNRLKDHITAIKAFARVRVARPDARLVLVGDGEERHCIEANISAYGLSESVQLLGLRNDVHILLPAADLFWLTSVSEGIPLTLIEAMAARLPVVATNVGGVSEIVVPEKTGLLAPAGDDQVLAQAVLRLAGDPALRRRFGEAGHARAMDRFCEDRMLDAYGRLYEDMLRV